LRAKRSNPESERPATGDWIAAPPFGLLAITDFEHLAFLQQKASPRDGGEAFLLAAIERDGLIA